MTTRAMTADEIATTLLALSYHPHTNVTGLCNGTARILYDGWMQNAVYVHSHIPEPRYLTKGFLREMFRYPFEHVDWIIGVTPGFNEKALAFNRRIGFDVSWTLPSGYAKGVDLVYQTMHHRNCRSQCALRRERRRGRLSRRSYFSGG